MAIIGGGGNESPRMTRSTLMQWVFIRVCDKRGTGFGGFYG